MPPTSFLSLPLEITILITTHLAQHDLAQCVRVCHHWFMFFTPSLWRTVKADDLFSGEEMTTLVARNAHFIRDLQLVNPQIAKVLVTLKTGEEEGGGGGLQSLVVSFERDRRGPLPRLELPPEQGQEQAEVKTRVQSSAISQRQQIEECGNAQLLGKLMRANQGLKFVSADETCFRNNDGTDAFQLFIGCCPTTSLERLELRFRNRPSPLSPVADFSTSFNDLDDTHIELFASAPGIPLFGPFKVLKELLISGGNFRIAPQRLAFLGRCANLERLQLDNIDRIPMASLSAALRMSCPHLSILEVKGPNNGPDDDLAYLLSSAKNHWREVSLPDMGGFGTEAFTILMASVRTRLEVLKVEGWGGLGGTEFLDILCSAQHLRRLEGPADGKAQENTTELTMWAYLAFHQHTHEKDRSWALGPSLEFLQIWIDDVPRPDIVCQRDGDPLPFDPDVPEEAEDVQPRYDVQRWVYTQLGRLTGLQELILGVKELDNMALLARNVAHLSYDPIALEGSLRHVAPTFIYRSLEFSLESGLELLAELKELRVLDVKSTAHRIGVAELDWMHVNWPKLKEIKGLISRREWLGDPEAGLEVMGAVEKWLDSHPHGIGSSFYS